ncbi:MAG: hypothetical protein IT280_00865 [Ignavibacteria bacterium]|nr:hypothetical protein [Ignavibacteria bacterium]
MLKLCLFIILFAACNLLYSQSQITGNYFIGNKNAVISVDIDNYYITYETDGLKRVLVYETNIPENDQVWSEYLDSKQTGTLVLKQDYSGGIYSDYRTNEEYVIKRKE